MKLKRSGKSFFHRLFILFIILILPVFFIKEYRMIKAKKATQVLPTEDFRQMHMCAVECKKFTFIVLMQNNIDSIEQNYRSIFQQRYSDYKVVYIDQGSTDGSVKLLKSLIKKQSGSVTLFECRKDHEAFQKYYEVVQKCQDDEIIIHLYGSDWLAHDEVLKRLNLSYSNPDIWLAYGQYLAYPAYKKGIYDPLPKKVLHKKRVHRAPWVIAPLKTFYAALFKKLQHEPSYFLSIKNENSLLLPLAEMGKSHIRFIPNVLFIHNRKNRRSKAEHKLAFLLKKEKNSLITPDQRNLADLLIFSNNQPYQLQHCIESSLTYLEGMDTIHVLYQCNSENFSAYEHLKKCFPHVNFIPSTCHTQSNFKSSLLSTLLEHTSSYVLLSTDQMVFKQKVSIFSCIEAMRKTRAYGFYLHLGKEKDKRSLDEGIYMWNTRRIEGPFQKPDTLKMGLYRRLDLEKDLRDLPFTSVESLIGAWAHHTSSYRIGLSFEKAKVITSNASGVKLSKS